MFRHEGPSQSTRTNAQLAGFLAFIAGFVNSGGFFLIGSFTSHVTGNVGRFGNDLANGNFHSAGFAGILVGSFFLGGLLSSMLLETLAVADTPLAYATVLAVEALFLGAFIYFAGGSPVIEPHLKDELAALLSVAMGMQNALVTRLSGAVVRTTHLTGATTDLSIEIARWYRSRRSRVPGASDVIHGSPIAKQHRARAIRKIFILCIIIGSFTLGAMAGAVLTERASRWAMAAPAAAIGLAALFALYQRGSVRRR